MALPTISAVGTVASQTTGAMTVPLPAGTVADHVLLMFIESANEPINAVTGWSNVGVGTVVQATGLVTALTVRWKRAVAGETAPAISSSTNPQNHLIARIIGVAGAVTTGSPINVTNVAADNATATTFSIPGATTTAADCLVFAALSTGTDSSTATASGWTNASLGTLTERVDNWTSSGNGGGIAVASGTKATAGAYSATTGTITIGNTKATMSFAVVGGAAATTAAADVATGAGSALAPVADLDVLAGLAAAAGTAGDAAADVTALADVAVGAGTAYDATVTTASTDTTATADVAVGAGSALDAVPALVVLADVAAATGTAFGAVAGLGAATGAAAGAGSALDGSTVATVNAGNAAATGSALDALAGVTVTADIAQGTGTAFDATAVIPGSTIATAELATATGTALDAAAGVTVSAGVATGTGTAFDVAATVVAAAESALGTGIALGAAAVTPPPVVQVGYTRAGSQYAPTSRGGVAVL